MASNDLDLRDEVREFTGSQLDDGELDTAIGRAKRHIQTRLGQTDVDWYSDQYHEDALFWTTCLFSKVASGELDGQSIRAGSVELDHLASDDAGQWAQNAQQALDALAGRTGSGFGITTPDREDRVYGEDGPGDTDELL